MIGKATIEKNSNIMNGNTLLKGVHNGRTMLSYIQEHIVCS